MKYRDPETGLFKTISVKATDTLPIGTIVDYDGNIVPDGWEKVEKNNDIIVSSTEPNTGEEVWIQKGKNLYNKNTSLDGYALSSSSGEIAANAGWTTSDFIPVVPNASIYISGKPTQGNGVCCYNASKTFVSTVTCREGTMTVPANCYYIRINLAIADKDTCQVEYGTTATTYEAYIDKKIYTKNDNNVYEEFYDENKNYGNIPVNPNNTTNFNIWIENN